MKKENKISIFIIDDSLTNEEQVIKIMRSAGYAAHTTRLEDEEDLTAALEKKAPDILLYAMGMPLSLEDTIACLQRVLKHPIPVIAVNRPGHEGDIIKIMRAGARDLASFEKPAHLELVIKREMAASIESRKMHHLETSIKESERRCQALLDSSRDAIAYIHEGMHIYSNKSYLDLFKFEASEDLEGMPILDMVGMDDRDKFKNFLRDNCKDGTCNHEKLHLNLKNADSTEFEGEMEFSPASIDGEPCVQVIIRNQSNSKELEQKLAMMSQKDTVTGLFNRQHFVDSLATITNTVKESNQTAAVMLIHLDNFADIKQSTGVVGSDKYLKELADKLTEATIKNDLLARFEGGVFSIICNNQTAASIRSYAQKLQKTCANYIGNINNQSLNSTSSIGISIIDQNAPDTNEILLRAERAVTEAKQLGSNNIVIYQPKAGELTQKEIDTQVTKDLKDAITNNRFILYYQPIISLHGDTDERYEVFVRLLGKDGKVIMPNDFLPAANRTGMSLAIDRWILFNTITTLTQRWKDGKRTLFFVKLTANSIKDSNLMNWLKETLIKFNVPKNSLIFQVKESTAVTSLKHTAEISKSLKELNCSFTLDDFGTGSNPFELLKHVPADYLKLEKSFMENLSSSPTNQEALKKITEQAMTLNKLTIAQCVQDATSLSVLWGMGINFIQGNFLQEPMPELNYDFTAMMG
ncbi:MAG: multidomain signaling protein FimX [Pseudomonadota bacterium]|nr:multidomain signaling protein FimX [Pseudomonadota bacterium]